MTENTNYIFEELFKAAQPNRGLFVMPLPTGAGKTPDDGWGVEEGRC